VYVAVGRDLRGERSAVDAKQVGNRVVVLQVGQQARRGDVEMCARGNLAGGQVLVGRVGGFVLARRAPEVSCAGSIGGQGQEKEGESSLHGSRMESSRGFFSPRTSAEPSL